MDCYLFETVADVRRWTPTRKFRLPEELPYISLPVSVTAESPLWCDQPDNRGCNVQAIRYTRQRVTLQEGPMLYSGIVYLRDPKSPAVAAARDEHLAWEFLHYDEENDRP